MAARSGREQEMRPSYWHVHQKVTVTSPVAPAERAPARSVPHAP